MKSMSLSSFVSVSLLAGAIVAGAADAVPSAQTVALSASSVDATLTLHGQKSVTLYRSEEYESTCYRTIDHTEYRTQCDPVYENRCSYEPTEVCRDTSREECSDEQVCRDVMREVCGSSGCQSFPTRECSTESRCRTVPDRDCSTESREVCRNERVRDNCYSVPYTVSEQVPYSCTKIRQVPIGTELTEDLLARVRILVDGDVASLSGKDALKVSVADGLDLSRPDTLVQLAADAGTHVLTLEKVAEQKTTLQAKQFEIAATYRVRVKSLANLARENATGVSALGLTRDRLIANLSGRAVDKDLRIRLQVRKDQLLGGWKTTIERDLAVSQVRIVPNGAGQQMQIDFAAIGEGRLNGRPHEATLTLSRDAAKLATDGVLNPQALRKIDGALKASQSIRVDL